MDVGLGDPAATRYLANHKRMASKEDAARRSIADWVTQHGASWVAVSGGKDSTVLLHLVSQVAPHLPMVFFDSGLEYPQTRPYLESLAVAWGFDFHVIKAKPDALSLLEASGHWEHGAVKVPNRIMDEVLIKQPQAEAIRRWGNHGIYGLRADESPGRSIALHKGQGVISKHGPDGSLTYQFLAPLWRWRITDTSDDINGYAAHHKINMHPVYSMLTKMGISPKHQRVGILVSGWGLDQGVWAKTHAVAPEYCRLVEQRLPILSQFR